MKQIQIMNKQTREQSQSSFWFEQRAGQVTASSLYTVYHLCDFKDCWYTAIHSQHVSVNGGLSRSFQIKQGVPQASYLWTLLFTPYTTKLFEIVRHHLLQLHCYADNTHLYFSFCSSESSDAVNVMSNCIMDLRAKAHKNRAKGGHSWKPNLLSF